MPQALQTVQSFVAPVVMISANGLLCLAFYNRLAAAAHRVREINRERFQLETRMASADGGAQEPLETAHLESRVATLDELGHRLLGRVRLLRDTLVCLLVSVLFMLACSLALGLASLIDVLNWVALGCFVLGVVAMGAGVVRAIQELAATLSPLVFEHEMLERMSEGGPAVRRAAGEEQ